MFETTFRNLDDTLRKVAGCSSELAAGDIAICGQESNFTTWRLAKMNLAVLGIEGAIRWNYEGSFRQDQLRDEKFDFILAKSPFNISD